MIAAARRGERAALRKLVAAELPGLPISDVHGSAGLAEAAAGADVALLAGLPDLELRDAIGIVHAVRPDARVVFASSSGDPDRLRDALDAGALSVIFIDGDPASSGATLRAAALGHGMLGTDVIRAMVERYSFTLERARLRDRAIIESLTAAVEAKDSVTSTHQYAVSRLAIAIAALVEPSLAASEDFLFGALLHDVGKIGVPEEILAKPGPLNDDEWEVMRRHPETGVRVIRPLGMASIVSDIVLHHHERWDGEGYPHGMAGKSIPLAARIFAVSDSLEAMTAPRPYRDPLPPPVALERISLEAGQQFDPRVVSALERAVDSGRLVPDDMLAAAEAEGVGPRVTAGSRW